MWSDEACSPLVAFERLARLNPESIALRFEGETWNYARVNYLANRIAHSLRQRYAVVADQPVALLLPRDLTLIPALLGIMKSGACPLPLDPEHPPTRLNLLIRDADVRVGVGRRSLTNGLQLPDLLDVDGPLAEERTNPEISIDPGTLAYLTYTSGSTGRPKGCMVTWSGFTNYSTWFWQAFFPAGIFHFGLYAPLSFDLNISVALMPLVRGGSVTVFPETMGSDEAILACLSPKTVINGMQATPSHLLLVGDAELTDTNVRVVQVGGEVFQPEVFTFLRRLNREMVIFNGYGPTETTQGCITRRMDREEDAVLIGRPIANMRVLIMSPDLNLQPPGVAGEICMSGTGLARGYLNRPGLTAERFVPNPHGDGDRLYRTGDLARWTEAGELVFLGRSDHQVKIRGHRVECGEIEAVLRRMDGIDDVVVLAGRYAAGRELSLACYFVSHQGRRPDQVRDGLSLLLPSFMVPAWFVALDALPMGAHGKLDRVLLPHPTSIEVTGVETYEPPTTLFERQLVDIWQEVLGRERIGVEDNFYTMGGHSLKASQIVSRIRSHLARDVGLPDLFHAQTVRALAQRIGEREKAGHDHIETVPDAPDYPLSHAQKRLWLLDRMNVGLRAYNMTGFFRFHVLLDARLVKAAVAEVIRRHESLRTGFIEIDGVPRQVVADQIEIDLAFYDLRQADSQRDSILRRLIERMIHHFYDLTHPPLFEIGLAWLNERESLLLFSMHHIIGDGWSMVVLYQELMIIYDALSRDRHHLLPDLEIQYRDFAAWQRTRRYQKECRYWKERLKGLIAPVALPADYQPDGHLTFQGGSLHVRLSPDRRRALEQLAFRMETTMAVLILAVFKLALYQITGQSSLLTGMSLAGRNRHELERLIGFFVNPVLIHTRIRPSATLEDMVRQLTMTVYEAFEHDLPFDVLVRELNPERYRNRQPVFNVAYVFQNFEDLTVSGTGFRAEALHQWEPFRVEDLGIASIQTARFDLTLMAAIEREHLVLRLEYSNELFRESRVRTWLAMMHRLCDHLVDAKQTTLPLRQLIDAGAHRYQAGFFDDLVRKERCRENTTIDERFAKVAATGRRAALQEAGRVVTYGKLAREARRIAIMLQRKGVTPGTRIGVWCQELLPLVAGCLGVLRTGACLVLPEPVGMVIDQRAESESWRRDRLGMPDGLCRFIDRSEVSILLGEIRFLNHLYDLLWLCPGLEGFVCLDVARLDDEPVNPLGDRCLWEFVGEEARNPIEGGGWRSSYTGATLSTGEMREYADGVARKLAPWLHPTCRVLEIT